MAKGLFEAWQEKVEDAGELARAAAEVDLRLRHARDIEATQVAAFDAGDDEALYPLLLAADSLRAVGQTAEADRLVDLVKTRSSERPAIAALSAELANEKTVEVVVAEVMADS